MNLFLLVTEILYICSVFERERAYKDTKKARDGPVWNDKLGRDESPAGAAGCDRCANWDAMNRRLVPPVATGAQIEHLSETSKIK